MEHYDIYRGGSNLSLHTAGLTAFWLMNVVWGSGKIVNLKEKDKSDWKLHKAGLWAREIPVIFLAKDK